MKYRKDIDGLRALAVMSVIIYHYSNGNILRGGYVGVDVFFVISGFLITSIIYGEMSAGTYSVIAFYYRRVKRILPALFFVYAFCMISAFFIRFPYEAGNVGKSVMSSVFFVSNIYFSTFSGYFDFNSASNPLLHTWSLSVEEQYYVFFPLLIFVIRSAGFGVQRIVVILFALASLILSEYQVRLNSTDAFYLVQNRAWELLLGATLGMGAWPKLKKGLMAELLAIIGLSAILASIFSYTSNTLFPGISAALPCLGAVLMIYAGAAKETFVSRLFSLAPLRFIGIISYSLYLWHWPLFIFAGELFELQGYVEKSMLLAACFAISLCSWKFIEEPFRKARYSIRSTFSAALIAMFSVSLFAFNLDDFNRAYYKYPQRIDSVLSALYADSDDYMRAGKCFLTVTYNSLARFNREECLAVSETKPNVLLIGDSHAAHLWAALSSVYPNANFLQATASGCRPLHNPSGEKRCVDLINSIYNDFLPRQHLNAVILAGRWKPYEVQNAIDTAAWLTQYADRVLIFGPINEYYKPLPRLLAVALAEGKDVNEYLEPHKDLSRKQLDEVFTNAALPNNVFYISTYKLMTEHNPLIWADAEDVPMQFDYGHLTPNGAKILVRAAKLDSVLVR